jgi:hypothetical protein
LGVDLEEELHRFKLRGEGLHGWEHVQACQS